MLPIKIINKSDNPLPEYKTEGSVGMDLSAHLVSFVHLIPGQTILIPTGLFMSIPYGYEGNIKPRSGLSLKEELVAIEGTIDSDYRGEIGIIIRNNSDEPKTIQSGDRIAQIVFRKVEKASFQIVEDLDETERGQGGFGSTGIKYPKNIDDLQMDILDKSIQTTDIHCVGVEHFVNKYKIQYCNSIYISENEMKEELGTRIVKYGKLVDNLLPHIDIKIKYDNNIFVFKHKMFV